MVTITVENSTTTVVITKEEMPIHETIDMTTEETPILETIDMTTIDIRIKVTKTTSIIKRPIEITSTTPVETRIDPQLDNVLDLQHDQQQGRQIEAQEQRDVKRLVCV